MNRTTSGFTIVELLIVIVVIGILAAITMTAYNGIQNRARTSKINSDLASLTKAIQTARTLRGTTLHAITGSDWTSGDCENMPTGSDLANKTTASDCWADYTNALRTISAASGVNVNQLADPWGRPYFIDENESTTSCEADILGVYSRPFVSGWASPQRLVRVPAHRPDC